MATQNTPSRLISLANNHQPQQLCWHTYACRSAGSNLLFSVLPRRAEGAAAARQCDDLQARNSELQTHLQEQKVGRHTC
jgi:hypothetical protein